VSAGHAAALATLLAWQAPDPAQERLRSSYVDHLRSRADGHLRTCRPDHLTASVLVVSLDASEVLLTHHRRADAWFQLGGHVEPGDVSLAAAAERELREESGLTTYQLDPVPVQLDRHTVAFCGDGGDHLDVRFVAIADPAQPLTVTEESHDVRWWPAGDLPSEEESLHDLVARATARVAGQGSSAGGTRPADSTPSRNPRARSDFG
jgi:8-oxo-dGTP pyrophosphatase MutT (NUDIX family)